MRAFAILPAAGASRRMGRPKLLLPWGQATMIERTLAAWRASRASAVLVTVHPEAAELASLCQAAGAIVVRPAEPPADMKASVRLALAHVERNLAPSDDDVWLLAPADMPLLTPATIDRLIGERQTGPGHGILAPSHCGRRGHPVLFPWPLAREVAELGDEEGINAFVRRHVVREIEVDDPGIGADIDTPEDYRRLGGESSASGA